LLDIAAPLAEQLPAKQCNALHLERSVAIVVTTAATEECYYSTALDDRILLHIQAATTTTTTTTTTTDEKGPHYSSGILHPGSLKERGDYCLVYISLATTTTTPTTANESIHRWQVQKVDFKQMEMPERGRW
jgi:hypothetical protein